MKKIKTFFHVFKNSLTSFSYYTNLRKSSFFFSLQYLVGLLLIVSTITVIAEFVGVLREFYPRLPNAENIYMQIEETFPDDYSITINNGTLTTNKKEPVILGRAFTLKNNEGSYRYTGLIAIDPGAEKADYQKLNTFIVLSKSEVIVEDNVTTLPPTLSAKIDKNYLISQRQNILKTVNTFISLVPFLVVLLIPIVIIILAIIDLISYMVLLLVLTLFAWSVMKVMKRPFTYWQLYRYGMHAITPLVLFSILVTFFPMISTRWSVFIYVAWMIGALTAFKQKD